MSKPSLKLIRSLKRLPNYFNQANATFQVFKEYHYQNPLISYFAGLYTVQILIDTISTRDSITQTALIQDDQDITTHLVTFLEIEHEKLQHHDQFEEILKSHIRSRDYLIEFVQELFETASTLIETGQASGKTVTDLLTCATIYEITRGLFPYTNEEISEDDDSKMESIVEKSTEVEDEGKNKEEVGLNGSQDLSDSLANMVESQDDIDLENHITKSIKNLTNDNEDEEIPKEDEIINKIIQKDLSKIDDEELDERITYCRKNAQRIITAVKKGENPQKLDSIDSTPITEEEIAQTIKLAMDEPSDNEDIAFPELPQTAPGVPQNDTKDEEPSDAQEQDPDTPEYIAQHHTKSTTPNKPIPKQLNKQDIQIFLKDGELLERATKCAKFAISAINYEDIDTAMAELTKSMELLEKFKENQS